MDDLSELLAGRPELADVAVVDRDTPDGRRFRIAYVVPDPATTPGEARRVAVATAVRAAGVPGGRLAVAVVSGIPRAADGTPDVTALAAVPVAATAGVPLRRLPAPTPARRHLADLTELPPRWGVDLATGTPDVPPSDHPSGPAAEAVGDPPVDEPDDPATLPEALLAAAERWPDRGVRLVEADGERRLSHPELLDAARRVLGGLRHAGLAAGDPVVLHAPSLVDHFVALWAGLLGGLRPVAVAQAPGYDTRNATLDKLEHAWRSLGRPVVLSGGTTTAALGGYAAREGLDGLRVLDVAALRGHEPAYDTHRPAPDDVAMLQLSSGSTSRSKVIPLTHRGIVRYAQGARQVGGVRSGDVLLNWLPLDHVAGVVMYHLGPVVLGCENVHVGTSGVLADPLLWLDLLERHGVRHSWSPNFGYRLVTEALRGQPERRWDLRGVRGLINAGEQCTEPVVRGFLEACAPFGLGPETMLLAWGMAETCTAISYQPYGPAAVQHAELAADGAVHLRPAPVAGGTTFLSMGRPAPGARFRITAPDGRTALPERHVGRLQVRSDRVTPGYLDNDEANRAAFPDGDWFDTGDLAFLADGRVTITGRGKEIIIVNGVHHFCHEIEDVVATVDGVAPSFVAAVGAPDPEGAERIVVLFVPDREVGPTLLADVRRALADRLQITSAQLVPVDRDRFDKTTSGKIQRSAMRARLLAGGYEDALRRVDLLDATDQTVPDCVHREVWRPRRFRESTPDGPVLVVADRLGLAGTLRRSLPDPVVVDLAAQPLSDSDTGPWAPEGGAAGPGGDRRSPADAARWTALLRWLAERGTAPTRVIFAASYLTSPDPGDPVAVEAAVRACAVGLLGLVKALADTGWSGNLLTLSRGLYRVRGDEPGCPPAALTAALGETFGVEHPAARVWHLDLPGDDLRHDAAVVAAATGWSHREPVVVWRGGPLVRLLERVEPVAGEPVLPRGSRWLVTGGLGGIGRTVLADLVTELDLRLLVVGRRPVERGDPALTAIAGDRAGRVWYAPVDVTDGAMLRGMVSAAERDWGARLDGVLHLAGGYEFGPLATITPERWRADAAAKIDGSLTVARLLRERPGSRLVAFSSLLSLVPVVGAGAYAAGNRFLEALGEQLRPGVTVHRLSWGLWRGVGMSAGRGGVEAAARRHMLVLSPAEGRALTRLVLRQPPGDLLVGVDPDAPRLRHMVRPVRALEGARGDVDAPAPRDAFGTPVPVVPDAVGGPDPAAPSGAAVPTPAGPPGRDRVQVARTVREVLRRVVPGGVDDSTPFHDAGLDSVRLLRLHTLLRQALGRDFPQTALFTHGTPAALAGHLAAEFGGGATGGADTAASARAGTGQRIAVIGMAARFPGADTVPDYWRNLLDGRVDVRRFSRDELLAAGLPAALVDDPDFVPVSGALADIARFDAELFGVSPREAALTDPQQRLFLEVCHEALEAGGYAGAGRRVGVFAGSGMHLYALRSYLLECLADTDPADQLAALQVVIGNQPDFLATRVAYRLGLTGPALSVQTACSTSLVAVHLAARSLLAGETDLALAGAAALHVPAVAGYRYQEGSILSRTGVCRPFDDAADGTVGGNGVAAVLLKRLDDALADGDPVLAVILGTAVNNDGTGKTGYTAPSVTGHAGVVREALAAAGVDAGSIGYVETHGTGTRIGDPIEVAALRAVFAGRRNPLPLGAVKANIGHLDTCAGMAGLIKAVMAVRDGRVPPIAGLRRPSPELRLADGPFVLPTSIQPWPLPGPRRAGVSSLGVGGTNAHVVVEEPPPPAERPDPPTGRVVVPLSAQSPEALRELAGRVADRLAGDDPPRADDLLVTLGAGRRALRHRLVVWSDSAPAAAVLLRRAADPDAPGEGTAVSPPASDNTPAPDATPPAGGPARPTAALATTRGSRSGAGGTVTATVAADGPGPLVFACSGQGVDLTAAATGLMAHEPAREVLERCAGEYRQLWDGNLLAALLDDGHEWTTATVQPALFAVQVALGRLLESVGVRPDVLVGHSAGEYAALCLAGALSVSDGLHLTALRGQLLQRGTPEGAALAVLAEPERLATVLDRVPGLELTVHNGPRRHVLAGTPPVVGRARAVLDAERIDHRPLAVHRAFHSYLVEPVLDELAAQAATLDWRPLRIPLVTGVGGARLAPGTRLGADHVRRQTREPADYRAGVAGLVADGCVTFVEIGPDSTLTALGRQWAGTTWIPTQRRRGDRAGSLLAALAALFGRGVAVDWAALAPTGRRIALPTYPFRPVRHWAGPGSVPRRPAAGASSTEAGGPPAMTPAPTPDVVATTAPDTPAAPDPGEVVLRRVRDIAARHLGESPERIPPDVPFFDLGADSLLMINLLRELETTFAIRVSMRELFEDLDTPQRLSAAVLDRLPPDRRAALAPSPTSPAPVAMSTGPAPEPAPPSAPSADPLEGETTETDNPDPYPSSTTAQELVRAQLELLSRFTDLMARQLAALNGTTTGTTTQPGWPTWTGEGIKPDRPERAGSATPATPATSASGATTADNTTTADPCHAQLGPRPLRTATAGGRFDARQQAHFDDLVRRYTERTRRSKELTQRQRRWLADSRAVVGFRRATKEMLYPIAARRASGAHLEDIDGNTYVDITMGFGALLFGHEPAFLRSAIEEHLADGLRLGPRSAETGEAARLLCELTGMDRAAFATTGTEANSAAFRLARAYTGRQLVVTFDGSYHGHFDPVLGRGVRDGDDWRTLPVSAGIPDSAVADVRVLPYGAPESLDVIRREAHRIAAVVVEPVQSRYPDRQPVEFVRELRALCDRHGMVLLFDEMLTGFRPHPRGAQGVFGVHADLATYGKVIGGGYPIGAVAGRADIMDWVDGGFWRYGDDSVPPQDTTFFGGTYIQHPLSMVAAKAVLSELRERGPGLQEQLNRRTERLARAVNEFCAAEEFPVRVVHFGSLFRFSSTADLSLLFNHLLLAGVHVWEWRNFFLSDAHTDADVDLVVGAVRESLHELRRGGFLPGGATPPPAPATRAVVPPVPRPGGTATPTARPGPARPTVPLVDPPTPVARRERRTGTPDFSLYFFGDYPRQPVEDQYAAILAAARFADERGLHAVWLPERHFDSFGGIFPNPSVLAAAVAARTSRVRIHAGCAVLPLHDPIRVAEEWSVVDNLSGGRIGIGCASGWHARDFALAPQAYGRHREAMYEAVEQIRTLWRGGTVTRPAGNGEPVELRLFPRPVQEDPPMFTAVIGNPDSYRRAAAADLGVITNLLAQDPERLAANIALYRAARAEHGLDPAAGRVVLLLHTYLGPDTGRAREEAFGPFCDYLRSSLALFGQVTNSLGVTIDLANTPEEDVEFLLRRAYARYTADRALIGSPEDCRAIVERFTALGVDEIGCFIDFGLPPDRMLAGLPGIDRLADLVHGDDRPADPTRGVDARLTAATAPEQPAPAASTPEQPAPEQPAPTTPPSEQPVLEAALGDAQREIWFVERMLPGRPTYTETKLVELAGPLDIAALRGAVELVVRRHPALRSVFREVNGQPRQIAPPPGPVEVPVVGATADLDEVVDAVVRAESDHRFDLATGPLFAPRLIRFADDRHLLVLRMHHLVIDTLSARVLSDELAAGYRAAVEGRAAELPPPPPWPVPTVTDEAEVRRHLAWWVERLDPLPPRLDLPTDRPRPAVPSGVGGVVTGALDAELTRRVREFARTHRCTPFMVLLAGFAAVLGELGGQREVLLGTPVAYRPPGTEGAVGLFVNTLPLRIEVAGERGFGDLVRAARGMLLDAQEHQDVPLQRIVRALDAAPEPGRHPLLDVVIEFDSGAVFELDLPGVRATLLDAAVERAPFDLTLFLTDRGGTIDCQLNFARDLFDPGTAQQVLRRFSLVLHAGTAEPDRPLIRLPMVTAPPDPRRAPPGDPVAGHDQGPRHGRTPHRDPVADWQDGGPPAKGADQPLPAALAVDRAAVLDRRGLTSGADLRRRAEAVEGALTVAGVGPGQLVAIHLPRGADAVVAMLGVLRAGAGYVPLDPDQPTARLATIVRQAQVSAVVTSSARTPLGVSVPTVLVDWLDPVGGADPDLSGLDPVTGVENTDFDIRPDDVAYVLFTSGSTGRPKGCVIAHRAIANTVAWYTRDLGITSEDRLSWYSSPGFDASCVEVWPALRAGATLCVVPDEVRPDPARLRDWLTATGVTVAFLPTPMGELLIDQDWSAGPRPALRHLVVGGDRLRRGARPELPFRVTNVYGPTEATVISTWAHLDPDDDGMPPIGRPVPGTWVRVLDAEGRPAPVGVAGELHLGGVQLGRGYLAAPDETARRFLRHPAYGPVFRTGDVVRWRPDGQLEFLRRTDAQVQIRGQRAEPGEVEHVLRQLDGVRDAAVRAWRNAHDEAYLAAYVVPADEGVDPDALLRELARRLPAYLVPTVCLPVPELPRLDSGKLDRAALPEPDLAWSAGPVPPADPLERRLHDIWCAELGLTEAPVTSTFFRLGGSSLTALRLLNRVADELGRTIEVVDFLREPTIRAMARRLAEGGGGGPGGRGADPPPTDDDIDIAIDIEEPPSGHGYRDGPGGRPGTPPSARVRGTL